MSFWGRLKNWRNRKQRPQSAIPISIEGGFCKLNWVVIEKRQSVVFHSKDDSYIQQMHFHLSLIGFRTVKSN